MIPACNKMNLPAVPVAGRATAESRFRVSFFIRIGRRNLGKNLDAGISRCNARNEVLVNTCLRHFVILNDVRRVRRRGFRDKFSPVVLICQRISRRARTGRAGGGEKKKRRVKIGGRVGTGEEGKVERRRIKAARYRPSKLYLSRESSAV